MRRAILTLAVLAVAAVGWAMNLRYSSGTAGILVTDANTPITFTDNHSGGTTDAFGALSISVCSRSTSANACFVDSVDSVATTADDRIEPGACLTLEYMGLDGAGYASMGAICAAGETATFDVKAGRHEP